jgi:hypothetical protein
MNVMAQLHQEWLKQFEAELPEISRKMSQFSKSTAVFSDDWERLLQDYEGKWVAIYDGHVAAVDDTLTKVMRQLKRKKIHAGETAISHIVRDEPKFML